MIVEIAIGALAYFKLEVECTISTLYALTAIVIGQGLRTDDFILFTNRLTLVRGCVQGATIDAEAS